MRPLQGLLAALLLGAASLVGVGVTAPNPAAAADCDGVWVVVDASRVGGGVTTRCAPGSHGSGLAALQAAGHSYTFVPRVPGMVCTVDGRPDPCNGAPTDAYWSYWHAPAGGSWTYSDRGAGNRQPAKGTVDGWAFGSGQPPGAAPPAPAPAPEPEPPPSDGGSGGGSSDGGASTGGTGDSGSSGGGSSGSGASGSGADSGGSSGGGSSGGGSSGGGSSGGGSSGGVSGDGGSGDGGSSGGSGGTSEPGPPDGDPSGEAGADDPAASIDDDPEDDEVAAAGTTRDDDPRRDADRAAGDGWDRILQLDDDGDVEVPEADEGGDGDDEVVLADAPRGGRSATGAIAGGVLVAGLAAAGVLRARRRGDGPAEGTIP
jgi:hypothetical protein